MFVALDWTCMLWHVSGAHGNSGEGEQLLAVNIGGDAFLAKFVARGKYC